MTDKAYIVANKKQELEFLEKFEQGGLLWNTGEKPTKWITSEQSSLFGDYVNFPYALIEEGYVAWLSMTQITDQEIVYDGRKEENMYKVTQEFMDELIKWRDYNSLEAPSTISYHYMDDHDLELLPVVAEDWWLEDENAIERNNRLIAIIRWLNGDDIVFKVEAPSKFVIRSEKPNWDGDYWFVRFKEGMDDTTTHLSKASKFDTREEAQEWANSHQVVIEIDEEGNEVE